VNWKLHGIQPSFGERSESDASSAGFLRSRVLRSRATAGPNAGGVKNWDAHVEHMEQLAGSPAFMALRDRVIEVARVRAEDHVLDIGSGTGLLTLAVAPHVTHVSALDISPAMCARLRGKLDREEIGNVNVLTDTATALPLDDDAKRQALAEIARVLRPGGRLVFADMMFSLDLIDRRNRAVIALLIKRVLRHGPAGMARLAKHATRIMTGHWERPVTVGWWHQELHLAGFTAVSVQALEHEGGIASARAPRHRPVEQPACSTAQRS
jgi:SAM-dependent methyltransferase